MPQVVVSPGRGSHPQQPGGGILPPGQGRTPVNPTQPLDPITGEPIFTDAEEPLEMSDARIVWGAEGGDLGLELGDLAQDPGLVTAVLASIFSDARALPSSDRPSEEQDLRGVWFDTPANRFGSLVWLLARAKQTNATLAAAREYVEKALAWLVSDRIARTVVVRTSWLGRGALLIEVELTRGTARRWAKLWKGTEGVHFQAGDVFLNVIAA